jgi:hypothetical protein
MIPVSSRRVPKRLVSRDTHDMHAVRSRPSPCGAMLLCGRVAAMSEARLVDVVVRWPSLGVSGLPCVRHALDAEVQRNDAEMQTAICVVS